MANNQNIYISNCDIGMVAKNNSTLTINSYVNVSGCLDIGINVFDNSTINSTRGYYTVYDYSDSQINSHNCGIAIVVANNSAGNIQAFIRNTRNGIIFSGNSTGQVFYTSLLAAPGTSSLSEFNSGVYVQDSTVLIRDLDDTSGWGSTTGPAGYTGPTSYRVNGGSITVVTDEGLVSPEISAISIGPRGGKVDTIALYNSQSLTGDFFYNQRSL